MSDASSRAALEAAQVSVRELERELDTWPAVSPARAALAVEVQRAQGHLALTRSDTETAADAERRLRDELDRLKGGARARWWMSVFAPVFAIAGLVASCVGAMSAVTGDDWWLFARQYGLWLALAPFVVNGLRVAVSGTGRLWRWSVARRAASPSSGDLGPKQTDRLVRAWLEQSRAGDASPLSTDLGPMQLQRLVRACLKQGRAADAVRVAKKAVQVFDGPEFRRLLAEAWAAEGQRERAQQQLGELLDERPDDEEARRLLDRLRQS